MAVVALALLFAWLIPVSASAYYGSLASWYGPGFYGNYTASEDVLDYNDWSAAHKTLPFGTKIKVCYQYGCARGVEITDRGPYTGGRTLDLNKIVADRIGLTSAGVDHVE